MKKLITIAAMAALGVTGSAFAVFSHGPAIYSHSTVSYELSSGSTVSTGGALVSAIMPATTTSVQKLTLLSDGDGVNKVVCGSATHLGKHSVIVVERNGSGCQTTTIDCSSTGLSSVNKHICLTAANNVDPG